MRRLQDVQQRIGRPLRGLQGRRPLGAEDQYPAARRQLPLPVQAGRGIDRLRRRPNAGLKGEPNYTNTDCLYIVGNLLNPDSGEDTTT